MDGLLTGVTTPLPLKNGALNFLGGAGEAPSISVCWGIVFCEDGLRGCCDLACCGEGCGNGVGSSLRLMVMSSSLELESMSGSSTGEPVGVSLSSGIKKLRSNGVKLNYIMHAIKLPSDWSECDVAISDILACNVNCSSSDSTSLLPWRRGERPHPSSASS